MVFFWGLFFLLPDFPLFLFVLDDLVTLQWDSIFGLFEGRRLLDIG